MGYYGFPEYVPVAQKRAQAAKKLKALRKKNPDIEPVVIEGRLLADTWWGKSWNKNLERYADYSNRIGRGRSYARHGAVLDLKIEAGEICALVQGSRSKPYQVEVAIEAIDKVALKRIRKAVGGQLESLAELLAGKFPKPLQDVFFASEKGLFPVPHEIHFDCSCPDWADMCKHVAATLYGVGARLDEKPELFFELRRIEMDDLITQAVESTTQTLLQKAERKSDRVMDEGDLADVFGIELDDDIDLGQSPPKRPAGRAKTAKKAAKKASAKERGARKAVARKSGVHKPAKKAGGKKQGAGKTASGKALSAKSTGKAVRGKKRSVKTATRSTRTTGVRGKAVAQPAKGRAVSVNETGTLVDIVVAAIPRRRKRMSIAAICALVELSGQQVRNAVARAVAQGRLEKRDRGIYVKV